MENRYLTSYEYNCVRILDELRSLAESEGGRLVTTWKTTQQKIFAVHNRSRDDAERKARDFLSRCKRTERNAEYYDKMAADLARYESASCPPVVSPFGDYRYIQFELNGACYYYSMDDNPFFGISWCKRPVNNGAVGKEYYHTREENPTWLKDCHLSMFCTSEECNLAAEKIFEALKKAKYSEKYSRAPKLEKLWPLEVEQQ